MDSQINRQQSKQIAQLHPSALQIVKEHISQEEVESPQIPPAMSTSHTKKGKGLMLDEILQCDSIESLKIAQSNASPKCLSLMGDQINHLNVDNKSSDFQIIEKQANQQKNLSQILGATFIPGKIGHKPRSLSIAEENRRECLSQRLKGHSCSSKKLLKSRKAKTNNLQIACNDDRSLLLGVKRASKLQILDKQVADLASPTDQLIQIEQLDGKKRKKQSQDDLKLDLGSGNKDCNNNIKAIESDDAMEYLRVRKQKGVCKYNKKQSSIFDKIELNSLQREEAQLPKLGLDPFKQKKQVQELFSDNSSIMGGKWYDQKNIDFKFEVTSNVDSIDFPMNQNLNLNLNINQADNNNLGQISQKWDDLDLNLNSPRQPFQFTGDKVLQNQQLSNQQIENKIKNDKLPVESDKKVAIKSRFDFSNLKAFDQILEDEKQSSQIDNDKSNKQ